VKARLALIENMALPQWFYTTTLDNYIFFDLLNVFASFTSDAGKSDLRMITQLYQHAV